MFLGSILTLLSGLIFLTYRQRQIQKEFEKFNSLDELRDQMEQFKKSFSGNNFSKEIDSMMKNFEEDNNKKENSLLFVVGRMDGVVRDMIVVSMWGMGNEDSCNSVPSYWWCCYLTSGPFLYTISDVHWFLYGRLSFYPSCYRSRHVGSVSCGQLNSLFRWSDASLGLLPFMYLWQCCPEGKSFGL